MSCPSESAGYLKHPKLPIVLQIGCLKLTFMRSCHIDFGQAEPNMGKLKSPALFMHCNITATDFVEKAVFSSMSASASELLKWVVRSINLEDVF